jgi:hypothetical protein
LDILDIDLFLGGHGQALPLVFEPPSISILGIVFWAHGWCVISSSLKGTNEVNAMSLVLSVALFFCSMAWFITKGTINFLDSTFQ